jgi:hypothetical protein
MDKKITANTYETFLSDGEVKSKKIIVTKQALKIFPKPWKDFQMAFKKENFTLHIESESCTCMGPQKPHNHYWLRDEKVVAALTWKVGIHLKFQKIDDKQYKLEIL